MYSVFMHMKETQIYFYQDQVIYPVKFGILELRSLSKLNIKVNLYLFFRFKVMNPLLMLSNSYLFPNQLPSLQEVMMLLLTFGTFEWKILLPNFKILIIMILFTQSQSVLVDVMYLQLVKIVNSKYLICWVMLTLYKL